MNGACGMPRELVSTLVCEGPATDDDDADDIVALAFGCGPHRVGAEAMLAGWWSSMRRRWSVQQVLVSLAIFFPTLLPLARDVLVCDFNVTVSVTYIERVQRGSTAKSEIREQQRSVRAWPTRIRLHTAMSFSPSLSPSSTHPNHNHHLLTHRSNTQAS